MYTYENINEATNCISIYVTLILMYKTRVIRFLNETGKYKCGKIL